MYVLIQTPKRRECHAYTGAIGSFAKWWEHTFKAVSCLVMHIATTMVMMQWCVLKL